MVEKVVREWTQLIGPSKNGSEIISISSADSISTAADGSIYITGYTNGDLDGQTNSGSSDAFISKYNSDGSKQWTQLLGGSWEDKGTSISTAADGSIFITGYTKGDLGV